MHSRAPCTPANASISTPVFATREVRHSASTLCVLRLRSRATCALSRLKGWQSGSMLAVCLHAKTPAISASTSGFPLGMVFPIMRVAISSVSWMRP